MRYISAPVISNQYTFTAIAANVCSVLESIVTFCLRLLHLNANYFTFLVRPALLDTSIRQALFISHKSS